MSARTSQTDPIRVDWLAEGIGSMPGRLGMTLAPGKSGPSRLGARWERDLWYDLRRLDETCEVDCLVTLLAGVELVELGIEELFEETNGRGIDCYWYPWFDGEVPESEDAVEALVDHMMSRVYSGERVVVHCRGGLGRSGTLVGCCLRSIEYEPERAMEIVRDARTGAIENERQEEYVREYDGFWLPFHFLASHHLWREFRHIDDFEDPEPDEYPADLLSDEAGDEPAIRIFTPGSEPDTEPDPDEPGVFEEAAERFREFDVAPSEAELDAAIDSAVENAELDVGPKIAAAAFARMYRKTYRGRGCYAGLRDRSHVRNAFRRLLLRASEADDIPFDAKVVHTVERNVWRGEPAERHEADRREFRRVMHTCALRFDGYDYLDHCEGAEYIRQMQHELEAGAPLEKYDELDKCAAFFHLQRWLGRGGGRSPETSPMRRVFRELFIHLHDVRIDRRWTPSGSPYFYDEWRWLVRPVAKPYVEMAREDLERIEYEYA